MGEIYHLAFHYVREEGASAPGALCSITRFRKIIERLLDMGVPILTCEEIAHQVRSGESMTDVPHATLSFDDGYREHIETVVPILLEYGIKGTFFVNTNPFRGKWSAPIAFQTLIELLGAERLQREIIPKYFKGAPQLMMLDPDRFNMDGLMGSEPAGVKHIKWVMRCIPQAFRLERFSEIFYTEVGPDSEQQWIERLFLRRKDVRMMHEFGMGIASHTRSHPMLSVTPFEEAYREFADSLADLEEVLPLEYGRRALGYPFGGQIPERIRSLAMNCYDSCWNYSGTLNEIPPNPYADLSDIPRMDQMHFVL